MPTARPAASSWWRTRRWSRCSSRATWSSAGYRVVGPARSLKHGLLLAAQEGIDAALVDVSLGRETSAPIADQLLARNIPFAFATGYSGPAMLPEHLRADPGSASPMLWPTCSALVESLVAKGEPPLVGLPAGLIGVACLSAGFWCSGIRR